MINDVTHHQLRSSTRIYYACYTFCSLLLQALNESLKQLSNVTILQLFVFLAINFVHTPCSWYHCKQSLVLLYIVLIQIFEFQGSAIEREKHETLWRHSKVIITFFAGNKKHWFIVERQGQTGVTSRTRIESVYKLPI